MKTKRAVHILVPHLEPHDAIGNDVLRTQEILSAAGYDARILAETFNPSLASLATEALVEADELWRDRDAILIYHHSIHWPRGEKILLRSKNRIVIKYHNITPPSFFAPYAQNYYRACLDGIDATGRIATFRIDRLWGASQFNVEEFIRLGFPPQHCRVAPPLHRIEHLGEAAVDTVIVGKYRDHIPNLLFVGAFRPNKGHFKAIETLAAYRTLTGLPARLLLVGSFDHALHAYRDELLLHARMLDVEDSLHLAHSVPLTQLRAYYSTASVFLCVSEHEGFCVPLVEAMFFRVPIVAWNTTAVGETCGGCGIVYDAFNAETLAEGIDEAINRRTVTLDFAARGRRRYETVFSPDVLEAGLLALIEDVENI